MNIKKFVFIRRLMPLFMMVFLTGCVTTIHPFSTPTPDFSDPCYVPPDVAVDGAVFATIKIWNDLNGNGEWDNGERPLPWVTLYSEADATFTDTNGEVPFYSFRPGCPCNCWKGTSVSVKTPFNYQATTPVEYELTSNDQTFFFGFRLVDGAQVVLFPGEPDWFQLFTNQGILLTSFHYNSEEKNLIVEINNSAEQDIEQLYSVLFWTIYDLEQIQVSVQKVTVTVIPSNEKYTCLLDDVLQSDYLMTYREILHSKCSHP
jgi:hypothetical protein